MTNAVTPDRSVHVGRPRIFAVALLLPLMACGGEGEAEDPGGGAAAGSTPTADTSGAPFPSFEPLRFGAYGLGVRVPSGFEAVGGSGRGDRRTLESAEEELWLEIEVGEGVVRPGLDTFLSEARRGVERVSRQDTLPRGVEVLGFDAEGRVVRRRLVLLAPQVVLRMDARYPEAVRVRAGAITDTVFASPTFTGDFGDAPGEPGASGAVPRM